jgi:iron complex outermembrane receptor protein
MLRFQVQITLATFISIIAPHVMSANDGKLEEIIVTAQRKAESLQDTPISLMAFNEDRIEKEGINSLMDLKANVPGMTIEPFPLDNSNLRIYIRGVGLIDTQVTQDTPIGVYMDGIYIARSAGLSLDLAELQRIEVLRGPQGTLYGRNSTGGTVNLITRRADTGDFSFEQKFTIGNYGLLTSKTSANIPVSDKVAIKAAFLTTKQDGIIENTGLGEDFGERSAQGFRIDLRADLSDRATFDYSYESAGTDYTNLSYQPFRPQPLSGGLDADSVLNDAIRREASKSMVYSEDRQASMFAAVPILESSNYVTGHKYDFRYSLENIEFQYLLGVRDLENNTYADVATGSLSSDFRVDTNAFTSKDGSIQTPAVIPSLVQDQISHEFKINGSVLDNSIDYIIGLYTFAEDAINQQPYHLEFTGLISNQTLTGAGNKLKTGLVQVGEQQFGIKNSAQAFYARLSYKNQLFNRELLLTVGGRHSEDERQADKFTSTQVYTESWTEDANGNVLVGSISPVESYGYTALGDRSFRDDSFDYIIEYQIRDELNVYFKSAEAYKSGGYNTRDPDPDFFTRGFDEEKALSYELGFKGEFFDNSLRVNADIFQTTFTDLQINFQINGAIDNTRVLNVGEAEINGFEIDITYALSRDLLAVFNYSHLDAKITSVIDPDTGENVADQFVFSSAPENAYTATLDWTITEGDFGVVEATMSYNFMDSRNGGPLTAKVKNVELESFGLLNGRLGLSAIPAFGGTASVAFWLKNILDEEYVINAFDHLPQAQRAGIWGDPRTYGIDVIIRF